MKCLKAQLFACTINITGERPCIRASEQAQALWLHQSRSSSPLHTCLHSMLNPKSLRCASVHLLLQAGGETEMHSDGVRWGLTYYRTWSNSPHCTIFHWGRKRRSRERAGSAAQAGPCSCIFSRKPACGRGSGRTERRMLSRKECLFCSHSPNTYLFPVPTVTNV